MIIIGIPLHLFSNQQGAVFIYQSLHVMQKRLMKRTKSSAYRFYQLLL